MERSDIDTLSLRYLYHGGTVKNGKHINYFRWKKHGDLYYYDPNSERSKAIAKAKAIREASWEKHIKDFPEVTEEFKNAVRQIDFSPVYLLIDELTTFWDEIVWLTRNGWKPSDITLKYLNLFDLHYIRKTEYTRQLRIKYGYKPSKRRQLLRSDKLCYTPTSRRSFIKFNGEKIYSRWYPIKRHQDIGYKFNDLLGFIMEDPESKYKGDGRGRYRYVRKSLKRYLKDKYDNCQLCGKWIKNSEKKTDHIIPATFGGPSHLWNLSILCRKCNQNKWHLLIPELVLQAVGKLRDSIN